MSRTFDFVVVGGGIIGLAIARELMLRQPGCRLLLLEKEASPGRHASGRNSGVLHSGLYYKPGSVKARVCAEGARELAAYCDANDLPLARVGKVIVPVRVADDAQLDVLRERALRNRVRIEMLDAADLRALEPHARSDSGRALYSPDTAVVDPRAIVTHLAGELAEYGAELACESELVQAEPRAGTVRVNGETIAFGHLFNAAGLNADRVARLFGAAERYAMLPFRGSYYRLAPDSGLRINGLIYPVPDLRYPFLGVHVTQQIDGSVSVGPTALPALGRENYRGLEGIAAEALAIGLRLARQYLLDRQGFRRYAHAEVRRCFRRRFADEARLLLPDLRPEHLLDSDKRGIRAQLVDRRSAELVMDFVVEEAPRSTHVLNAVSPGFTSAFSFARLVVDGCQVLTAAHAYSQGM